ncbi:MAG: hypothetical protein M1541_02375 [Acidobacteria bacterium]|nr:hypothetical protein [Acidobacteriota bacterium]
MRFPTLIPALALALTAGLCASFAQMTVMNGASYDTGQPHAPGSFVTVFGQNLCSQTATAQRTDAGDLPTTLGACSVRVNGVPAMLHFASPGQINFVMPMNVNPGDGTLAIQSGSQVQSGPITVGVAGPGVFAMNGMGVGDGAVLHATKWKTGPFSVTTDGQPTPLSIFLTGLDLTTKPSVLIGGMPADVTWYGQTPGSPGLQQINITLTPEMAGAGRVSMSVVGGIRRADQQHHLREYSADYCHDARHAGLGR